MPDLGEHRVVGGRRRVRERGDARVGVAVVLDRELLGRARDVEDLLARRPQRGGGDPLLERLGEHERLERGAGLALALGGEVERRAVVVVAADHRADLAGLVLDRHQRGARAAEVGQPGADRVVGRLLEAPVDRRLDGQAALERLAGAGLAAAELVDDLLLDPGREVGVLRLLARRLDVAAGGERLGDALVVLLARDQALVQHPVQDEVAALLGGVRVGDRVIGARRGHDAGDQRGLRGLELRGAGPDPVGVAAGVLAAEVGARGGLDAVGAVAEVDRVEVVAQDLLLRPLAREVVRHRGLAQLHEQRSGDPGRRARS